jgi:hypothetical protein
MNDLNGGILLRSYQGMEQKLYQPRRVDTVDLDIRYRGHISLLSSFADLHPYTNHELPITNGPH